VTKEADSQTSAAVGASGVERADHDTGTAPTDDIDSNNRMS